MGSLQPPSSFHLAPPGPNRLDWKPSSTDRIVGGRLKAAREAAGLTLQDVSMKAGLGLMHLVEFEMGLTRTSSAELYRLVRLYDISFTYLFS